MVEDMHVDHARELFHQQREWLEARFVSVLTHADPGEVPAVGFGPSGTTKSRGLATGTAASLLALVCVHFETEFIRWPAAQSVRDRGL